MDMRCIKNDVFILVYQSVKRGNSCLHVTGTLLVLLPVCADEIPCDYSLLNLLMHNSLSLLAEG